MAQPNKIRTSAKEARVRELAAKGYTYRQISDTLKSEGVDVSHAAVGRFLQEETEERRAAARSVAATEAKDSVPLVTNALRQLVIMNMTAARAAYKGSGSDTEPKPDVSRLALATRGAVAAARSLHAVTTGSDPEANSADDLLNEVQSILAAKRKREGNSEG